MSHVATIDLEIKDLDALAAAAKFIGLEFVKGQETYKWYGSHVGDYPLPQGFKASELGKCEHALRIPKSENTSENCYEVGVVRRRDGKPGYTLLWDFWNRGYGLQDKIGDNGSRLKQEYAAAVATRHAQRQGYRVTRTQKEDGRVILTASKS